MKNSFKVFFVLFFILFLSCKPFSFNPSSYKGKAVVTLVKPYKVNVKTLDIPKGYKISDVWSAYQTFNPGDTVYVFDKIACKIKK